MQRAINLVGDGPTETTAGYRHLTLSSFVTSG
jgi:hypothetical protein